MNYVFVIVATVIITTLCNIFFQSRTLQKKKAEIFDEMLSAYTSQDVRDYAAEEDIFLSDEEVAYVTRCYVEGEYDATLTYWENIARLINKCKHARGWGA